MMEKNIIGMIIVCLEEDWDLPASCYEDIERILITTDECVITDAFGEYEKKYPLDKFQLKIHPHGDHEFFVFSTPVTSDEAMEICYHEDDTRSVSEEEFLMKFKLRHINSEWEELLSAMREAALDPKKIKELLKL